MRSTLLQKRPMKISENRRQFLDGTAMFIYLCIVYAWSLKIFPLGRDFACMADPGAHLPFLADRLFAWEVATFRGWATGYHIVNMAFMYACMLCLYRFVRLTVKGYFWLGTLAATLFMANPVHTEAMLNWSGVGDLIPCLAALLAITAYAEHANAPKTWKAVLFAVYFAFAVLPYRQNAFLVAFPILFEILFIEKDETRNARLLPALAISGIGLILHRSAFSYASLDFAESFGPLYLVFYPLGLLPKTARALATYPVLEWVGAAVIVFIIYLIYRKARRRIILVALLSMVATRFLQGDVLIDPVHMIGGGKLLLANAFFNVALVATFFRMMDHYKWRRPVVMLTTLLAVVFFIMELRSVGAWQRADQAVRQFQYSASQSKDAIGILPDSWYVDGAPLQFSESVSYDTFLSKAIPHVSLLKLNYVPDPKYRLLTKESKHDRLIYQIEGKNAIDLLPYPFTLATKGGKVETQEVVATALEATHDLLRIEIRPRKGTFDADVVMP